MNVPDAAEGVVRIIDVKMQEAIKAISTMRGHDLREFHLLAFGVPARSMRRVWPLTSAWPALSFRSIPESIRPWGLSCRM